MDIANITIVGKVGRDPETTTAGDTAICRFSVATNKRTKKGGEWVDMTTWWKVTAFGKTAEFAAKDLAKGVMVAVSGEAFEEEWTDKDGGKRKTVCVEARTVAAMRSGGGAAAPAARPAPAPAPRPRPTDSDEAPF